MNSEETSPPKKQKVDHPVVEKILENNNSEVPPVPTHESITDVLKNKNDSESKSEDQTQTAVLTA